MIELKNINVSQYFDLEDKSQYDFAMKYAFRYKDPVDEYQVGDIMELPFGLIKDFQYAIEQGLTMETLVDLVLKITGKKSLAAEPLYKFCRFTNYLIGGINHIIEIEQQALAYEADAREKAAGLEERFRDLGIYLQIRSLTGGDVTKINTVRSLPYSLCFTELYTAKLIKEYNDALKTKR